MTILGAHMSIAGGYHKAVERAAEVGCDCVQIFVTSPRQFPVSAAGGSGEHLPCVKPLSDDDVSLFRAALKDHGIGRPLAHASYLINLASPNSALWKRSLESFVVEWERADRLQLEGLVLHPGSATDGDPEQGLQRVIRALDEAHQRTGPLKTRCLLETTAGQGSNLGWRFEHLEELLGGVQEPSRLGVCLDTCHVFAAGYDLRSESAYAQTMKEFQRRIGTRHIRAFHLNDSKQRLGSRVDRHENIGLGKLGSKPFRLLLNDSRFRRTPMYLETPKGKRADGTEWDVVNLRKLRRMVAKRTA